MEKKTIEEAAHHHQFYDKDDDTYLSFYAGAEWYANNQSERMYSGEDLREAFKAGQDYQNFDLRYAFNEWVNQFKKS